MHLSHYLTPAHNISASERFEDVPMVFSYRVILDMPARGYYREEPSEDLYDVNTRTASESKKTSFRFYFYFFLSGWVCIITSQISCFSLLCLVRISNRFSSRLLYTYIYLYIFFYSFTLFYRYNQI